MKKLITATTTALTGFALATVGFITPSPASAAPLATTESQSDPLDVEETDDTASLSFSHSRSTISASSGSIDVREHRVEIYVNDKRFRADLDEDTGEIEWGGGGETLDPADISALEALAVELHEAYLADPAAQTAMSVHVERIIRLTLLLAEAPAGERIRDYVVPVTALWQVPASEEATSTPPAPEEECTAETGQAATGEMSSVAPDEMSVMAAATCQRADEDGIAFMSCRTLNRTLQHDAAGHCFLNESVRSGPGSPGSMGECGTGIVGIGTYTYDCGDHDRCGRVHGGSFNPWDSECGDEYREANDDYLRAPISRC